MMMVTIVIALILKIEGSADARTTRRFSIALLLGVAYAASIGGIATLVGTPPNLSFTPDPGDPGSSRRPGSRSPPGSHSRFPSVRHSWW